jgi:hypothetical protein
VFGNTMAAGDLALYFLSIILDDFLNEGQLLLKLFDENFEKVF